NTGNIADDYAITATDTEGYELLDLPDLVRLAPGASALYGAQMKIASSADDGDVDSLTVIATSLASAGTVGMGTETILVSGGTSDVGPGPDEPGGAGGPGGGADVVAADAYALRLSGAHPFRDRLDLLLELPKETMSSVVVYATDGRKVRDVVHETLAAGRHALDWDGKDERGYAVASGTYFLLVRTAEWGERRRVVVVR
ncbi:MAG: hypothetical protein KDA27_28365, partial [Candidatus Eisenbacteria bacterium]|nr:hypothetical protein [Candidatus Eisenbacteria bacterium]